jgi:HAD superfamily hydrolase (TIGR01458 family)
MDTLRAVLLDIDGVLCVAGTPLPGAIEALARLRRLGLGLRLLTNTTRQTRSAIVRKLQAMGFDVAEHEVITGALAARRLLQQRGLRAHLLVHPDLLPDLAGIDVENPNAVLVGDAGDGFSYAALNAAMRVLLDQPGAALIAIARNRYFRAADGLCLDAGPFVAALEYATGVQAELTGKPAPTIFHAALDDLHCRPEQALMIGDDLESDVLGAQNIGLRGLLVRTGKYRPADEAAALASADCVADDFQAAVAALLDGSGWSSQSSSPD